MLMSASLLIFVALLFVVQIYSQDACLLQVPDQPLTPAGLMTPYLLVGAGCNQANIKNSRFVHAVILNTDNGQVFLYNPLVITSGTTPEVMPAPYFYSEQSRSWYMDRE